MSWIRWKNILTGCQGTVNFFPEWSSKRVSGQPSMLTGAHYPHAQGCHPTTSGRGWGNAHPRVRESAQAACASYIACLDVIFTTTKKTFLPSDWYQAHSSLNLTHVFALLLSVCLILWALSWFLILGHVPLRHKLYLPANLQKLYYLKIT